MPGGDHGPRGRPGAHGGGSQDRTDRPATTCGGTESGGYTCVELDGCDTACRLRFIARAERVIEAGAALPRA